MPCFTRRHLLMTLPLALVVGMMALGVPDAAAQNPFCDSLLSINPPLPDGSRHFITGNFLSCGPAHLCGPASARLTYSWS